MIHSGSTQNAHRDEEDLTLVHFLNGFPISVSNRKIIRVDLHRLCWANQLSGIWQRGRFSFCMDLPLYRPENFQRKRAVPTKKQVTASAATCHVHSALFQMIICSSVGNDERLGDKPFVPPATPGELVHGKRCNNNACGNNSGNNGCSCLMDSRFS